MAFALLVLYLVVSRNDAPFRNAEAPVDVLKGDLGNIEIGNGGSEAVHAPALAQPQPPFVAPPLPPVVPDPVSAASSEAAPTFEPLTTVTSPPEDEYKDDGQLGGDVTSSAAAGETAAAAKLQEEFVKEYDALGL